MTVQTFLVDLPVKVKGLTVKNEDDSYSVFLNSRMAQNQIEKAYRHEMIHIERDDFSGDSVQSVEAYAHRMID